MTTIAQQTKTYGPIPIAGYGVGGQIIATVRHDDSCKNGHNSFAITATITSARSRKHRDIEAGGMLHDEIALKFPELAPLLKWHLCSTDGPMHYIENTLYFLGRRGKPVVDLAAARRSAIWPDMPEGFVITGTHVSAQFVEDALRARLPALLVEFRAAVESLGLVY